MSVHHHALGLTHHQLVAVGAVAAAAFLVAAWIVVKTLKLYLGLLFWAAVVVAAWGVLRVKNGS